MTRTGHGLQSANYLFNVSISRSKLLCKKNVPKYFENFIKQIFVEIPFQQIAGLGLAIVLK